jgi:hypothetical protein
VRRLPSFASQAVGVAFVGQALRVVETDGDWMKVEWDHGARCGPIAPAPHCCSPLSNL